MIIRFRNIKRDANNIIVSGSAALVENSYRPNGYGDRLRNHSMQKVVEPLGRVVWMDETDRNVGIFDSPSRGLVFYNLLTDEFTPVSPSDARLEGTVYKAHPERTHTSFGNTYLFLSEMEKTPFMNILRESFPDRSLYKRVLAHLVHDCLKNGSSIKCGEFLSQDWLQYLLTDLPMSMLDCDSPYFKAMSDDNNKKRFFTALVKWMRVSNPGFGRACYVDSTPLPGEAENNPFNALCSHGTDGAVIQSRLVLVLDIQTCIPIWFEIISSNILDKSTILSITNDVKTTLNIEIDMYDLDAGYARKELFELFNRSNSTLQDSQGTAHDHTVLVRMPATLGYPKDELYIQCKPHFYNGRYSFDYEHHTFFGERVEVELFGYPEYAFVFIDKTQAEALLRGWREQHQQEWEDLSDSAQDWFQVKDGFFILIGNKDQQPRDALAEYRGRAQIESFFRDGKAYLRILPLAKWNKLTVKGKIFHDVIETIFYRAYRKQVAPAGLSMSSLLVYLDSWDCFRQDESLLELKTPRTQVRELLEKLGYSVPGHFDLDGMRKELFEGIPMTREPVTTRTKRAQSRTAQPISPEEKIAAKQQQQKDRKLTDAKETLEKACQKADQRFKKDAEKAALVHSRAQARAKHVLDKKLASSKRDSTKSKATMAYNEAMKTADEAYEQAIQNARSTCEAAKEQAKAIYDDECAQVS